jgi:hypothetical protein
MLEKIQKDFDVCGVCSVPFLMNRYKLTKQKASEILGELKGVHHKYFSGQNEILWRVLNYSYFKLISMKEIIKTKKEHDFKNTDEEWRFILECRKQND